MATFYLSNNEGCPASVPDRHRGCVHPQVCHRHMACLVCSEVIIKRQHNTIRIAALIRQAITPRKMYFLIGYTEELLSYWMQCPVTLELQTVGDKKDVVFKYI